VAERFAAGHIFHDGQAPEARRLDPDDKRFLRERNIITAKWSGARLLVVLGDKQNFVLMVNERTISASRSSMGFQVMETFSWPTGLTTS
jgi:hypothetical protein